MYSILVLNEDTRKKILISKIIENLLRNNSCIEYFFERFIVLAVINEKPVLTPFKPQLWILHIARRSRNFECLCLLGVSKLPPAQSRFFPLIFFRFKANFDIIFMN